MIGSAGSKIGSFSCFASHGIVGLAAMTKPAWLNGLRHVRRFLFLPILPGFHESVMAIVSLLTSAAKLSLVQWSAGREAMPPAGRPADGRIPLGGEDGRPW